MCFGTDVMDFAGKFPKIRARGAISSCFFDVPFTRDYCFAFGNFAASKSAITNLLSMSNKSDADCNQDGFTSNAVSISLS
jgi:Diacylglycerol acyltransferase